MNADTYLYSRAIDQIVVLLEENEVVLAAQAFRGACSRQHLSQQGFTAGVRTALVAHHGLKADRFMAGLTAGMSATRNGVGCR